MFVESYNASFTLGTSGELRGRLHEKISARAETECESVVFLYLLLYIGHRCPTHAFMNFQPGLKILNDYIAKFSVEAEISTHAVSANRGLKFQPGLSFSPELS